MRLYNIYVYMNFYIIVQVNVREVKDKINTKVRFSSPIDYQATWPDYPHAIIIIIIIIIYYIILYYNIYLLVIWYHNQDTVYYYK